MKKHLVRLFLLSMMVTSLWGCATSPYEAGNKARSNALLARQLAAARQQIASDPAPRLLFAGIALDDRSEAFAQDVALAEKVALELDPWAVVFKLVNPARGQSGALPFATPENTWVVLQTLGALARPQDKVMLMLTSHGAPGRLAVHAGNEAIGTVTAGDLVQWMKPLRERQVLVVVSACFSGSLIPALAHDQHIVLTAAARDRASFGCNSDSDNTFFIKELFGQPILPTDKLRALMATAVQRVEKRELSMQLAPASNPQAFYGAMAQDWASQPVGTWFSKR